MIRKAGKVLIVSLMILNGLLFVSNIYVLGNTEAAIEMHDDLAPSTGPIMANAKVVNCFVVGILYLTAAYGIIRRLHRIASAGVVGFVLFVGFYLVELILWGDSHLRVWLDFSVFGGVSMILGVYSWMYWRSGETTT